jgi:hypothetical protein
MGIEMKNGTNQQEITMQKTKKTRRLVRVVGSWAAAVDLAHEYRERGMQIEVEGESGYWRIYMICGPLVLD